MKSKEQPQKDCLTLMIISATIGLILIIISLLLNNRSIILFSLPFIIIEWATFFHSLKLERDKTK